VFVPVLGLIPMAFPQPDYGRGSGDKDRVPPEGRRAGSVVTWDAMRWNALALVLHANQHWDQPKNGRKLFRQLPWLALGSPAIFDRVVPAASDTSIWMDPSALQHVAAFSVSGRTKHPEFLFEEWAVETGLSGSPAFEQFSSLSKRARARLMVGRPDAPGDDPVVKDLLRTSRRTMKSGLAATPHAVPLWPWASALSGEFADEVRHAESKQGIWRGAAPYWVVMQRAIEPLGQIINLCGSAFEPSPADWNASAPRFV